MGDDEGFTLIEILVTLVIIGISVSAVLAGLRVASLGSGDTRAAADASAVLTATAEQIEQAAYEPCPTVLNSAYSSARIAAAPPSDTASTAVAATVVDLSVWNGTSFVQPTTGTSCIVEDYASTDLRAANRMQRLTLGHGDDRLTFIKRAS